MINGKRIVSHPGIYIKEAIEELGLNQSEFAIRSGLSIKNVSTLISGDSGITFEVANKLANFFHNSVEGWMNLQIKYDLYLNQQSKEKEYDEDWEIVKLFDKKFINDYLHIEINHTDKEHTIKLLREAFNVGTLLALKHDDMYAFCKTSINKNISTKSIIMRNAWISLAERQSRNIVCSTFDKDKIINNIGYLKSLTLEHPRVFSPKLTNFLSSSGIKLVIMPYLPGSNISGVTKWLNNEKSVLVAINDCGKDADKIWFAIFHELGHAIQNHKRHITISYEKDKINDKDEIEANEFAKNALIDKKAYLSFIKNGRFDIKNIDQFAKEQNVASFVVIGRLQKEGLIPWTSYQSRKVKYSVV